MNDFNDYHKRNPHIYRAFVEKALKLKRAGREYYGAKAIMEVIRYDTVIGGDDGFKISNNYTAYYARKAMAEHEELAGFFRTKQSKADVQPDTSGGVKRVVDLNPTHLDPSGQWEITLND